MSWHPLENTVNVQLHAQLKQTKTSSDISFGFLFICENNQSKPARFFYSIFCFSQRFVKDPPRDRSCPYICRTTRPRTQPVYTTPGATSAVWSVLREEMGCMNLKKAKYFWKGDPSSQPTVLTQMYCSHLVTEVGFKHHETTKTI